LPTGTKALCPMATLYCPQDNGISKIDFSLARNTIEFDCGQFLFFVVPQT